MTNKLKIGVMGGKGSFSEEAGNYYCHKEGIKEYEIDYLITAENVLRGVKEGSADLGIFPIENSNGGIVYEAVHAMAKYNFKIEKMFEIDIRHNLLVRPGTKAEDIKRITSHQQALKQCRMYLKRRWPDVELVEYNDTAEAARDLSEGKMDEGTAVVANAVCAKLYGLEMLEEGIQDLKFNFTTFVVASKAND